MLLRTPVGLAITGIVVGGAICGVVIVVKVVDSIVEACSLPRRDGR